MAKVPKEVTRDNERRAWALRQQLWTHERIATELGLDTSTVTKMLKRIGTRYLQTLNEEVGVVKAEQVTQLGYIADEAMQAWAASKQASKLVAKKVVKGRAKGLDGDNEEMTTRVQDEDGDPRYLSTAMSAMADIRKILGVDAPVKSKVSVNFSEMSNDQLREYILSELAQLGAGAWGGEEAGLEADPAADADSPRTD